LLIRNALGGREGLSQTILQEHTIRKKKSNDDKKEKEGRRVKTDLVRSEAIGEKRPEARSLLEESRDGSAGASKQKKRPTARGIWGEVEKGICRTLRSA